MQQGASEAKIADQARKMGMPLPAAMREKPTLLTGLELYWRAFWEVSTDRDIGMAEGPIPWTAMDRWATRYGIKGDEFERFVLLLKAMDSVYIEHRTSQHKRKMEKATASAKKGGSKAAIRSKGGRRK